MIVEKKTIEQLPENQCTGCMACMECCPKGCIEKVYDEEGFWRPQIDKTRCVDCSVCVNVCPQLHPLEARQSVEHCIALYSDGAALSSSGGAFYGMAQTVIEKLKGVVCGCIMDEKFHVKHVCAEDMKTVALMQGSKYVQSDLCSTFREIREFLTQKRWVLFSGTPCQVAGLKKSLGGQNTERLITVDLVCHGVPSPTFWENHAKAMISESECGKTTVKFRRKDKYERTTFEFNFSNGKKIPGKQDAYYSLFLKGLSFRESCYLCHYATDARVSDITIGDCNTWTKYMDFHPETAVSIVLCNTQKGVSFWRECEQLFETTPLDVQSEIKSNKQLNRPSERKAVRDYIYKDLAALSEKEFSEKYSEKMTLKDYMKMMFKKIVPVKNREQVRRVILKYVSSQ